MIAVKQQKKSEQGGVEPSVRRRAGRLVAGLAVAVMFSGVAGTSFAQLRRGTPIDAPPTGAVSLTNRLAASVISTNATVTNLAGKVPAAATMIEGEYVEIGFERLSAFPMRVIYETGESAAVAYVPKIVGDIPPTIQALGKKKVAVKGFMLPLKQADGLITEFLLLQDQSMCCYGASPKVNEWIQVEMKGKGVRSIMDDPVIICGTLHVGEYQQNQQMAGVYRLEGDKLVKVEATQ